MRKPLVMVVDDDPLSRMIVARKLKSLADVVEAEDGSVALDLLQSANIDLVIVDLEMPKVNGVELIRWTRAHPTLRHIPIIVLTANEMSGGLANSFMAGTTSALLKPLDWRAFGEHVRHVLALAFRCNHIALHDHLTGLPNRVLLNERLEHALSQASPQRRVATHILDLDHFKAVNDTLGHAAGDLLLKVVADRLRQRMAASDIITRIGGDEFVLVQNAIAHDAEAGRLALQVIADLSAPYDIDGREVRIGATVGISISAGAGCSPEQVLRDADVALYAAKRSGRGRWMTFRPTAHVKAPADLRCG